MCLSALVRSRGSKFLVSDRFGARFVCSRLHRYELRGPCCADKCADNPTHQATVRSRRWRFLATEPGRIVKWTWPSSSTATTRTTACPGADLGGVASVRQRGPAQAIVVLGVEVGYQVDVMVHRCPSSPGQSSWYGLGQSRCSQRRSRSIPSSRSSKASVKWCGLRPVGSRRSPAARSTPTCTRVSTRNRTRGGS